MKQILRFSMMLLACMLMVCTASADELVAFPGAQGFGRLATGGRQGTVYHVTNLNDSGKGSLRDAISQPNRIIVFDVSGVININSRLVFKSNQTIAGQTAPGEGITIYGDGMSCSGATNVIMRYVRFRMGVNGTKDGDCAGLANGGNMIFDHCSFAWGQDENFSINYDNKGTAPHDVTLQNCIVGQGLMVHSAGGLIQSDNITMYRTLLCDNKTRNFKVKGKHQYCNNIVYNWSTYAYEMGGESSGDSYANAVGNLFINGNSTSTSANGFSGGNSGFHFYGTDNWQDRNKDGVFNPELFTGDGGGDRQSTPYDYPELELYAGNSLIENLLPDVGATLPYRDLTDAYMVNEVLSFGTKGNLITSEKDLPYGTPDKWTVFAGTKKADTDGDGMPDAWETANGTNPNSDDAMQIAANGYANIENYINSITKDDRDYFLRAPYNIAASERTTTSLTITWSDFSDNETGFAVELENGGTWSEVGRTGADVMSYTIEGLQQATKYNVRVRAIGNNGGETFSDYATGAFSTRQEQQGIIDIATFEPDVTLGDEQTAWDHATTEWKEQKSFNDNDNVLLATNADKTLTVSGDVQPSAVVVKGTGNLTIDGAIGGSGSVNKAGTGTLILGSNNTYKGATVLHDGTIEISKLANGGEASSLGASVADAQNWVFDGGTYKYTGGDATTDRSALLLSPTTLNIAQSGKKITMNGSFEGAGDLIVDGAGQLLINNTAAFKNTGSLILKGGEVRLGSKNVSDNGIGSASKLVLQGGTFSTVGKNEATVTYNFPIEVVEGTTSTVDFDLWNSNKCTVTGTGTLIWNAHYLREYIEGNWDGFTGKLIVNGTGNANQSQFSIKNNGVKNATIELKGKASITGGKNAETNYLGGLSGESSTALSGFNVKQNGNGTWVVGGANTDETFKGIIDDYAQDHKHAGKTAITKAGTGYWRLTGNNTYSGATAVNGGTLIVNGKHSGTGAITVAAAGTLAGKGTLAGATTVNGTLMVGDDGASDKGLTFSGTLKLGSAAKLKLNDAMAAKQYSTSSTVQAFTGSVSSGTFAEIIPATPGEGLSWDTSALYTSGVLKVKSGGTDPGTDPDPVSAELSFGSQTTSSAVLGEAYTAPTLTNPYKVDVTYSSSNTAVATVSNDGAVTLVGAGETTITATFAGNGNYLAGSASYKLTVTEPEPQPQGTQKVCIAWGNCTRTGGDSSCTELVGNEASPSNNIGFSMHYTTATDKTYSKGDKMTYEFDGIQRTGITLSNGAQNSIIIPAGYKVTKVTFWSVTGNNTSDRVSYWKEVAGQTYTEADGQIFSHSATAAAPNKAVFNLNNVQNELTFTNTGEQQKVVIVLEYHVGDTPDGVQGIQADVTADTDAIYNLSGQKVDENYHGIVIKNGKKYMK